jgi:hypothetical protein
LLDENSVDDLEIGGPSCEIAPLVGKLEQRAAIMRIVGFGGVALALLRPLDTFLDAFHGEPFCAPLAEQRRFDVVVPADDPRATE